MIILTSSLRSVNQDPNLGWRPHVYPPWMDHFGPYIASIWFEGCSLILLLFLTKGMFVISSTPSRVV